MLSAPPPHRALAKSRPLHRGRFFPRLPKGYFTKIPIRSLPITNVPNHLQENLFTLCASGFLWQPPPTPHSSSYCICYVWVIFVCHSLTSICRGGGASWRCYRKKPKYDATLLSFRSDKYTVAEHQKGGGAVWCR